jgi:hypothetical protein
MKPQEGRPGTTTSYHKRIIQKIIQKIIPQDETPIHDVFTTSKDIQMTPSSLKEPCIWACFSISLELLCFVKSMLTKPYQPSSRNPSKSENLTTTRVLIS